MGIKRGELLLLFLISASLVCASAPLIDRYYYGNSNNFNNIGSTIYRPGTEIRYSYSHYSDTTPGFSISLYRLSEQEAISYQSINSFSDLIQRWDMAVRGKLYQKFLEGSYDPITKKYHRDYVWQTKYEKSGTIGKKLDKGIYLFIKNGEKSLYIVSDLEIFVKAQGDKKYLVLLNSRTGQLVEADYHFYSGNTEVASTHSIGELEMSGTNFDAIYIKTSDDQLFIENFHTYDSYRLYNDNSHIVTYTDRPVYRPNQTVFFKSIFWETEDLKLFSTNQNVIVEVYDPRSNKIFQNSFITDQYGAIYGQFKLGEEPEIGEYRIEFNDNYYREYYTFKVEEYRKPEFKLEVYPTKSFFLENEEVSVDVNATYYFGEPVPDTEVRFEVYKSVYYSPCYGYFECLYNWDSYYAPGYGGIGELFTSGSSMTDKGGIAHFGFTPEDNNLVQKYYIVAKATDKSRKEVEQTGSVTVAPSLFSIDI
jgi:uncharacterized protein YfaS (alpha-2-macroglobulin family)